MILLTLIAVLIFMALVMAAGWVWQKRAGNSGWVDVFWTFGTGLAGAACALAPRGAGFSIRQGIVATLVAIWALRLGVYIFIRVSSSSNEDARYKRLKQDWGADYQTRMFGFMQLQAPATMLLCLSILLAAGNPTPGLIWTDLAGAAILALAILGEDLADRQMKRFKADPANHGKVCDTGLWGLSRHPNYVFEGLGWLAYPVMALGMQASRPVAWLAWLGPIFMLSILRFATGVPPLEAAMLASKGQAFRDYQSRVPVFLPNPFKEKSRT